MWSDAGIVALAPPKTDILDHDLLPPEIKKEFKKFTLAHAQAYVTQSLEESLAEYEEQLIRNVLLEHDWNQSQTARVLKIPVPTLRYKMGKLGIIRPG